MALKPLPKLLIIAAVVGAVGYGLTKFLPKPSDQPKVEPTVTIAPPAPVVVAPPVQTTVVEPKVEAPAPSAPSTNVTSGDAGLNAVLGAGKKGR